MCRCSIVIRAYNEEKNIGRLLRGIAAQTVRDFEIIVVDSGSTDNTLAVASQHPIKVLRISPADFSFGRSLNVGCRAAGAEFIVLASAHVYPIYTSWLEELLAPFSDPHTALTYGMQRGADSTRFSEHQVFTQWFPDHSSMNQTHPFCNNANAAIRRSVWLQLPYDETLPGLEDLDWARRAMGLGYGISYAASAVVGHFHDETPMRIYNRYRREALAYKRLFPEEPFGFRDFIQLFLGNMISDYYHAICEGALASNFFSIPVFRFMQFWGTYRGHIQTQALDSRMRQTFYYPRGMKRANAFPTLADHAKRIDYRRTD